MKANESVKNYAASVRMYTNYTVREIKKICKNVGPRPAGSEKEYEAQKYIAEEMKTCADTVEIEEFKLHPKAFMGWVYMDGLLIILAIILSFFNLPIVSLVFVTIAIIFCFCEFLMYWEFYDPIYPKATSHNVVGTRKASGETKQRIIFSGHVDSSYEWYYTYLGGKGLLYFMAVGAFVTMFYIFLVSLGTVVGFGPLKSADEGILEIAKYIQLVGIPFAIGACCFVNYKCCVEGANDNLTGTVASVAILKYLEDNNIRFENTEVIAMSAGAEESGLRGSRAYIKRHKEELSDVPTIFVGLETFRDYDSIAIYERDMTGTVKMDSRVCALLKKGGELAGMDVPYSSVYFGASDAAAVQKLGIPAVTLAAMDPGPPRYYHTRGDTADNMDMKTVEKCLDIALQSLFVFDEQGLKEQY